MPVGTPPKASDIVSAVWEFIEYLQFPTYTEYIQLFKIWIHHVRDVVVSSYRLCILSFRPLVMLSYAIGTLLYMILKVVSQHTIIYAYVLGKNMCVNGWKGSVAFVSWQRKLSYTVLCIELALIGAAIAGYLLRRYIIKKKYIGRTLKWISQKQKILMNKYTVIMNQISATSVTLALITPHLLYVVLWLVLRYTYVFGGILRYSVSQTPLVNGISMYWPIIQTVLVVARLCHPHTEDSDVKDSDSVTDASIEDSNAAAVTAKDDDNVVDDEREEKLRKWKASKDKDNEKSSASLSSVKSRAATFGGTKANGLKPKASGTVHKTRSARPSHDSNKKSEPHTPAYKTRSTTRVKSTASKVAASKVTTKSSVFPVTKPAAKNRAASRYMQATSQSAATKRTTESTTASSRKTTHSTTRKGGVGSRRHTAANKKSKSSKRTSMIISPTAVLSSLGWLFDTKIDDISLSYDLLKYWVVFALLFALFQSSFLMPVVGGSLSKFCGYGKTPVKSASWFMKLALTPEFVLEVRFLFFVWLRYLSPSSGNKTVETVVDIDGSNASIASSNLKSRSKKNIPYLSPIEVVYSRLAPLALQFAEKSTSATKEKSGMVMAKLISFLDLAIMVRIISSKTKDLILLLISESVLMLPAALTLGMPSYFTQFGCLYVGALLSASASAHCIKIWDEDRVRGTLSAETDVKARIRYLKYWIVYMITIIVLERTKNVLRWVPFSTHVTLLILMWFQLSPETFGGSNWIYNLVEMELVGFGVLERTSSGFVVTGDNYNVEQTLTIRLMKRIGDAIPRGSMDDVNELNLQRGESGNALSAISAITDTDEKGVAATNDENDLVEEEPNSIRNSTSKSSLPEEINMEDEEESMEDLLSEPISKEEESKRLASTESSSSLVTVTEPVIMNENGEILDNMNLSADDAWKKDLTPEAIKDLEDEYADQELSLLAESKTPLNSNLSKHKQYISKDIAEDVNIDTKGLNDDLIAEENDAKSSDAKDMEIDDVKPNNSKLEVKLDAIEQDDGEAMEFSSFVGNE